MNEILGLVLASMQFAVAAINLVATLFCAFDGDYAKATYHLAWAILMSIFLAVRLLRKEPTNDHK